MSNNLQLLCLLAIITVALLSLAPIVASAKGGKKSLFKERGFKKAGFKEHSFEAPPTDEADTRSDEEILADIKMGGDGEDDVIKFSSEADAERKIKKLQELRKFEKEPVVSDSDLHELKVEEKKLRKAVMREAMNYGDISSEKAAAMHLLGRNLFKQQRYSLIYALSWDILHIHEKLDGVTSRKYAQAITNVASTAWKLGEKDAARILSRRQLGVWQEMGEDEWEKDIMTTRARLLSYQDPTGKEVPGSSHEEYKREIVQHELTSDLASEVGRKGQEYREKVKGEL